MEPPHWSRDRRSHPRSSARRRARRGHYSEPKHARRTPVSDATLAEPGALAEWLRSGLQSRLHRFDSGRRLSQHEPIAVTTSVFRAPMRARDRDAPAGAGGEHEVENGLVGIGDALPRPASALADAVQAVTRAHGEKAG